jgi:NitT/TauT family transport system ATP-binding protein
MTGSDSSDAASSERKGLGQSSLLKVRDIEVGYSTRDISVLRNVSLTCETGEIVAIVGKSGSGKSTLLRAIAGLLPLRAGSILFQGVPVDGPSRERGLVLQRYPVFPWLRVRQNVEFGAREARRHGAVPTDVQQLLARSGLAGDAKKYPAQLSGGMQQRLAIIRAVAAQPRLLLLDEPLGALDVGTRSQMLDLIMDLTRTVQQGILVVTHDIRDAVQVADIVVVLAGDTSTVSREYRPPNPRKWEHLMVLDQEEEEMAKSIMQDVYRQRPESR